MKMDLKETCCGVWIGSHWLNNRSSGGLTY